MAASRSVPTRTPARRARRVPTGGGTAPATRPAPPAPPALELLAAAGHGLAEAATATTPGDRFARAHLAALRAAAAVLAVRARPDDRRRGPRSVWAMLPAVAPELGEWAAYFAAGAGKRAAAEAGLARAATEREADDLLRDAESFLALVHEVLGLLAQPALPRASVRLAPPVG